MLQTVDDDEKIKADPGVSIPYAGSDREQWFLTENGFNEVYFQSHNVFRSDFIATRIFPRRIEGPKSAIKCVQAHAEKFSGKILPLFSQVSKNAI